jgi:hypothetical protein
LFHSPIFLGMAKYGEKERKEDIYDIYDNAGVIE